MLDCQYILLDLSVPLSQQFPKTITETVFHPVNCAVMMFRVYSALLFLFVVASTLGTASAQAKCRDGVTFTSLDTGRTLTRIITSESQCEFVCDFAESFPDDVDYSFKWEMSDETYDGACVCATPNCGPGVYETSSGCVCNPDGATCTMCTGMFF